jgi:hypothetical protein
VEGFAVVEESFKLFVDPSDSSEDAQLLEEGVEGGECEFLHALRK